VDASTISARPPRQAEWRNMKAPQVEILTFLFLCAFAPVFSIGWLRSRRNPRFLKLLFWSTAISAGLTILAVTALMGLFFYMMSEKCTDHYTRPLTVEEARRDDCPIPLPDSAHHVQFAFAAGGLQALEILVRFEAPPDVCRRQVQVVFDHWAYQNKTAAYPLLLRPLTKRLLPEKKDMVPDTSWFDIEQIEQGSSASGPAGSWQPEFWVDENRGIFYYKMTD
jgi:hypothetical protein